MAGGLRVAETDNQGQAVTTKPADKTPKVIRTTKPRATPDQRQAEHQNPDWGCKPKSAKHVAANRGNVHGFGLDAHFLLLSWITDL